MAIAFSLPSLQLQTSMGKSVCATLSPLNPIPNSSSACVAWRTHLSFMGTRHPCSFSPITWEIRPFWRLPFHLFAKALYRWRSMAVLNLLCSHLTFGFCHGLRRLPSMLHSRQSSTSFLSNLQILTSLLGLIASGML